MVSEKVKNRGNQMSDKELANEIEQLILSRREGEYWDFKEKHHKNKADLTHDIICMANNRAERDAYIIFGVTNDFEVKGVGNDENRRNQQNIIDLLKSKKFSGGIKPTVELKTLTIAGNEIDVLIIKDSTDTPYFLIEDYFEQGRKVRAHYIYTRVGDTNTPIDTSADINHVEYLWRKRFLLNRPPLEQIKRKLNYKNEWKREGDIYYNVYNPEYTLQMEYDEDRGRPEFYSHLMTNESTTYGQIKIRSYGTELYSEGFAVLDSGRYVTVLPDRGFVGNQFRGEETYSYRYFIEGTLDFSLHVFLQSENHEAIIARDRFYEAIVVFNSELEKEMFFEFLNKNSSMIKEEIEKDKDLYKWLESSEDFGNQDIARKIKTGRAIKKLLELFREQKVFVNKQ
jgi:hypothetical protein